MSSLRLAWLAFVGVAMSAHAVAAEVSQARTQAGAIPKQVVTEHGSFVLKLSTSPSPIPLNDMFDLMVEVKAKPSVKDPNPFWLNADAQMPEHNHGMNTKPRVEDLGKGKFAVRGMLFHMSGKWILLFNVAKGSVHEQARTEIVLE
jgi:hypothetical protein